MSIKQTLKNTLSASIFHSVRDIPWIIRDWRTKAPTGQGPIPPLRLMFDGPRGYELFLKMGRETLGFYRHIAGMEPDDVILDIGCGIGRKTLPLLDYLNDNALYVGMDLDRRGIDWLLRNVTSRNQRFVFLHQDIYNKFYNPKGALIPGLLVLPFPDASFDMVVLWSVFTHMYPGDIAHYLSEIARVLKPGGTLAASFFLYNDEILGRMQRGETTMDFKYALKDCRTTNQNMPEDALAVSAEWLESIQHQVGLQTQQRLSGTWTGAAPHVGLEITNFQDIVLAKKL
ncbi:MAG TPA: class I SAM-dependent methyltransferase [Bryobacteraceae bacterium]|nr:class I SAM-dependent methyltransferase [Acidobacteriaceae bacterium]